MPITKKDRIKKEHKKAEAAGTRIAINPNGTPVKQAKPKSICAFCRKELVSVKGVDGLCALLLTEPPGQH